MRCVSSTMETFQNSREKRPTVLLQTVYGINLHSPYSFPPTHNMLLIYTSPTLLPPSLLPSVFSQSCSISSLYSHHAMQTCNFHRSVDPSIHRSIRIHQLGTRQMLPKPCHAIPSSFQPHSSHRNVMKLSALSKYADLLNHFIMWPRVLRDDASSV